MVSLPWLTVCIVTCLVISATARPDYDSLEFDSSEEILMSRYVEPIGRRIVPVISYMGEPMQNAYTYQQINQEPATALPKFYMNPFQYFYRNFNNYVGVPLPLFNPALRNQQYSGGLVSSAIPSQFNTPHVIGGNVAVNQQAVAGQTPSYGFVNTNQQYPISVNIPAKKRVTGSVAGYQSATSFGSKTEQTNPIGSGGYYQGDITPTGVSLPVMNYNHQSSLTGTQIQTGNPAFSGTTSEQLPGGLGGFRDQSTGIGYDQSSGQFGDQSVGQFGTGGPSGFGDKSSGQFGIGAATGFGVQSSGQFGDQPVGQFGISAGAGIGDQSSGQLGTGGAGIRDQSSTQFGGQSVGQFETGGSAGFSGQSSGQFVDQSAGKFGTVGSTGFGAQSSGQFGTGGAGIGYQSLTQLGDQSLGQFGTDGVLGFDDTSSSQFTTGGSAGFGDQSAGQFNAGGSDAVFSDQNSGQFGSGGAAGFGNQPSGQFNAGGALAVFGEQSSGQFASGGAAVFGTELTDQFNAGGVAGFNEQSSGQFIEQSIGQFKPNAAETSIGSSFSSNAGSGTGINPLSNQYADSDNLISHGNLNFYNSV